MSVFKQYLNLSTCLLITSMGLYSYAHADLGTYNFILKGNAVNSTCGVEESESNKIVNLGRTATRQLKTPGDKGPRVAIPFNLVQCPPNAEVTFTFIGEQDATNNQLLALSNLNNPNTAKHAAIEISDINYNRVPISKSNISTNKSRPFLVDQNGNVSTVFYANYVATDASATTGVANGYAEFLIEYQ